jgi:hypothetical protein
MDKTNLRTGKTGGTAGTLGNELLVPKGEQDISKRFEFVNSNTDKYDTHYLSSMLHTSKDFQPDGVSVVKDDK